MENDLTPAEIEIALMIREDLSNEEIAARRDRRTDSVRGQVKTIMRKLGLRRVGVGVWADRYEREQVAKRIEAEMEVRGPHKAKKARDEARAE